MTLTDNIHRGQQCPFFNMNKEIFWDYTGYTASRFTQNELQFLHDEAADILNSPESYIKFNKHLVGQIEKEYRLSDETTQQLSRILMPWCEEYYNIFPMYPKSSDFSNLPLKLTLESAWINFQRKYEFNPLHTHNGVFSFVIWLQIPYLIDDEMNTPQMRGSNHSGQPGGLTFYTISPYGKIYPTYHNPKVNDAVVFPASMAHSVNPFYTSDDYRISVSGNFIYDM